MQKQLLILTGAAFVAVGVHARFGFAESPLPWELLPPSYSHVEAQSE